MGDLEQVEEDWNNRIKTGKNAQFDFVLNLDDEDSLLKIITAFANSDGGDLLIGINNKSKIIGLSPERAIEDLETLITKNKLSEKIQLHSLYIGHHIVLRIQVFKSSTKHSVIEQGKKIFFIRIDQYNIRANKALLKYWRMIEGDDDKSCVSFKEYEMELLSFLDSSEYLTLSKIYKKIALKNKDVDTLLSCLLYQNRIDYSSKEGQVIFKKS